MRQYAVVSPVDIAIIDDVPQEEIGLFEGTDRYPVPGFHTLGEGDDPVQGIACESVDEFENVQLASGCAVMERRVEGWVEDVMLPCGTIPNRHDDSHMGQPVPHVTEVDRKGVVSERHKQMIEEQGHAGAIDGPLFRQKLTIIDFRRGRF